MDPLRLAPSPRPSTVLAVACAVWLLAPEVAADGPDTRSPLVDVAIGATEEAEPLALFAPAWPGLHEMARCGEALLATDGAPQEVTLAVELTVQPDGRVSGAHVAEIVPETAASSLSPCVHARALALPLASWGGDAEVTATARLRLTREGSPAPRLLVPDERVRADQSLLSVIRSGEPPHAALRSSGAFGSSPGATDRIAIGAHEPDGSTGGGDVGMRGIGLSPEQGDPASMQMGNGGRGLGSGTLVVLSVEAFELRGTGDPQVFQRVVRQHRRELLACLERAHLQRELASGRFSLTLRVDQEGAVASALINETTTDLDHVEDCITSRARRWSFPERSDGGIVHATVVFGLAIAEAGE